MAHVGAVIASSIITQYRVFWNGWSEIARHVINHWMSWLPLLPCYALWNVWLKKKRVSNWDCLLSLQLITGIHLTCYYCQAVIGGILGIYCSKPKSCGFEAFYPRLSKIQCSIFKSSPFLCLQYVSLHSHTFWVPSIFTNQRWDYHLTSWKSPGYDVCMLEFARVVVRMRHGEGEGGSVDSLIASSPELIPRKLLFFSIKRIDAARRSTWKLMRQARPTRESLRLSSAWRWATGWKDERQKSWSLSWMSLGENVCWLYWWPSGRQTTKVELKERSLHPGPRTPPA